METSSLILMSCLYTQISNVVEVYVAGSDKPLRFTRARSTEQLDKVSEEPSNEQSIDKKKNKSKTATKPKKVCSDKADSHQESILCISLAYHSPPCSLSLPQQGGFLSRLLKPKSHKDKHKSKTTPRPLLSPDNETGLTASVSMPNIVGETSPYMNLLVYNNSNYYMLYSCSCFSALRVY